MGRLVRTGVQEAEGTRTQVVATGRNGSRLVRIGENTVTPTVPAAAPDSTAAGSVLKDRTRSLLSGQTSPQALLQRTGAAGTRTAAAPDLSKSRDELAELRTKLTEAEAAKEEASKILEDLRRHGTRTGEIHDAAQADYVAKSTLYDDLEKQVQALEEELGGSFSGGSTTIRGGGRATESGKNASVPDIVKNVVKSGLSQFNKGAASTLDFVLPTELLGEKLDFASKLNDYYSRKAEEANAELAYSVADRGKAGQVLADIGAGTVAAAPNALLALMSGGASTAAQGTTTGLQAASAAAQSGGALSTAGAAVQNMVKNPMFWTSFAQTAGEDYENAKADGANELEATATALIGSFVNAGVEIGGGLEMLPSRVKSGGTSAVREWVHGMLEEGQEEVVQGIVSNLTQKALYARDKEWASLTDENAVFNPARSAQEFGMGAAVGGILGGAQVGANAILNRASKGVFLPGSGLETEQTIDPAGEMESTAVDTDPARHTAAEQAVIDAYQAAVDEDLVKFVETAMENKGSNRGRYTLKPVTERAAADIKELTGIDTSGFQTVLEQRMAEHIVDRHGVNGISDASMRDINDIARMQYVLDNYDSIEDGGYTRAYTTNKSNGRPGQAKTVRYVKAVNGTYYVVEAVPDTKAKTAFIVSAYMSNAKTGDSQTTDAKAPAWTAKTENANSPVSDSIIRESDMGVNLQSSPAGVQILLPTAAQGTTLPRPGQQNTASTGEAGRSKMTMADFTDVNSPIWNNVAYEDTAAQSQIMRSTHQEMVNAGEVVRIPESTIEQVGESYPDLRGVKKSERIPILRQKMNELKASLRQFLNGLKGGSYEFEVNGNVLEAKLYDTGVKEVMEKITQDKASMLYHSDQIFENARYLYSTPDYNGDPNIYRWNYFYTPVQIGNQTMGVRIAVRDVVKGTDLAPESQIYNWGIKRSTSLDDERPSTRPPSFGVSSDAPVDAALDGGSRGPKVASSGVSSAASDPIIRERDMGVNPQSAPAGVQILLPTAAQGTTLPRPGQQNTASTGEAEIQNYQRAEHHGTILDTVRANLPTVSAMKPVAAITGQEFQKSTSDTRNLRTRVIEFFNSIGNKVTRKDLGEIELNTSGVRDSLAHGYGRLKAATFAALPQVLEQGELIEHNGPYEGHDYDSYIISAPVQVGNDTVYVGALVIKDTKQRYKLHEVLTASESGAPLFQSESTSQGADVPLRNDAPLEASGDASTVSIIPQTAQNVNGKSKGPLPPILPGKTVDSRGGEETGGVTEGASMGTASTQAAQGQVPGRILLPTAAQGTTLPRPGQQAAADPAVPWSIAPGQVLLPTAEQGNVLPTAENLQVSSPDGTIKEKYSLREEAQDGGAEKNGGEQENRGRDDARREQGAAGGIEKFERGPYTYTYRGVSRVQEFARQAVEEIKRLGIDAAVMDGTVYRSRNGIIEKFDFSESVTVGGKRILINNNTTVPPRETAGHEAFHYWKNTEARNTYVDVIRDNLDYSSNAFKNYHDVISNAYFDGFAELTDKVQLQRFEEELFAYISGHIHEGTNDELLRPMFRDYDAVKAAWEKLMRENEPGKS